MKTLLRRLRWLTAAERALRALRFFAVLHALLPLVQTAIKIWKRKGR